MTTLEKAPVDVVMPEVKLTIGDLAYMTGLMPGGTRCFQGAKVTDKLVFLGLIEKAKIPPCKKAVAEYENAHVSAKKAIRQAIKEGRWADIYGHAYTMKYQKAPTITEDFVLTSSGCEFMAKGRAKSVTSEKGGCIK